MSTEPLREDDTQKVSQAQDMSDEAAEKAQYDSLIKGFSALCVAAGFIAAIQSQIIGLITDIPDSASLQAIQALFLGGLLVDIMSAMMGYLTIRWLERMRDDEQRVLGKLLHAKSNGPPDLEAGKIQEMLGTVTTPRSRSPLSVFMHRFMALSLIIPFPFLFIGCICMLAGIYIYVWSQLSTYVAIAITAFGGLTLPFIICDLCIGRGGDRRKFIIRRIYKHQGDW